MSHYLLSVVTPTDGTPPAAEELDTIMKNVDTLHREMRDAGAWVFSGGLDAPDTATVVRPQGGELLLTDGPFAEAKEYARRVLGHRRARPRRRAGLGREGRRGPIGLPIEVRPFHGPEPVTETTLDQADARVYREEYGRARRHPGPPPRRHRPRRGGGPGRVRGGGAAVAGDRAAAQPRPAGSSPPPATGRSTGCAGSPPATPATPRRRCCTSPTSRWRWARCATTSSA